MTTPISGKSCTMHTTVYILEYYRYAKLDGNVRSVFEL